MNANIGLFGRVALAAKIITPDQLEEALREQARRADGGPLGALLIELGMITPEQLARIVELQRGVLEKARAKQAGGAPRPPVRAPAQLLAEPEAEIEPELELTPRTAQSPRPAPAPPPTPAPAAPRTEPAGAPAQGLHEIDPQLLELEDAHCAAPQLPALDAAPSAPGSLCAALEQAAKQGASDVHLHSGSPLRVRCAGRFTPLGEQPLSEEQARALLSEVLSDDDRALLERQGEVDFAFELPGVARVRANAYKQLRGVDAAFRLIPPEPPTLQALGLPAALARLTSFHQGMLLVTGPARCGKSSTLAALVRLINEERREHILSIEDPVEYRHVSQRCLVNQRSVKRHTESFASALRAALREDPDIIVIGELRDAESIALALTAAETGHFVLGTLHTDNAVRTINRIVGAFPPEQHEQVRAMLAESLRAVISQRLVISTDGSRLVLALEVMINNLAIGNLIRENKTIQLRSALQTGMDRGMVLLDQSLAQLVHSGAISAAEALRHCEDPKLIPKGPKGG